MQRTIRNWAHEYRHRRPLLALKGKTLAEWLCELRITAPQHVR